LCKAPITLDPVALLHGEKAACSQCGTALSLEPGESIRSALGRFEAARDEVQQVIGGRRRRG
jgi:hypothetical protein